MAPFFTRILWPEVLSFVRLCHALNMRWICSLLEAHFVLCFVHRISPRLRSSTGIGASILVCPSPRRISQIRRVCWINELISCWYFSVCLWRSLLPFSFLSIITSTAMLKTCVVPIRRGILFSSYKWVIDTCTSLRSFWCWERACVAVILFNYFYTLPLDELTRKMNLTTLKLTKNAFHHRVSFSP